MAQSPQVSLTDYFGGKSVVLRAVPEDFFKPYSDFLTGLGGKWNPHLKHPSGQEGIKLAGWIFRKTDEAKIREAVNSILSGQVPVATRAQPLPTAMSAMGAQPQNTLQLLLSSAQRRDMSQPVPTGNQSPVFTPQSVPVMPPANILTPINQLPGAAPPGYQQITYVVIKPETGGTLQLTIGGQKVPVKVQSVETQNGIVNRAIIQLPDDQKTYIQLMNDQWIIPKYEQPHSISLQ